MKCKKEFLVTIAICGFAIMPRSSHSYRFSYFECHFSKQCVAKLVHSLLCSYYNAGSCKSEKRAAKLCTHAAAINFIDLRIVRKKLLSGIEELTIILCCSF